MELGVEEARVLVGGSVRLDLLVLRGRSEDSLLDLNLRDGGRRLFLRYDDGRGHFE